MRSTVQLNNKHQCVSQAKASCRKSDSESLFFADVWTKRLPVFRMKMYNDFFTVMLPINVI